MTGKGREVLFMKARQFLVVDDDPVQTMVVSQMITELGARVIRSHEAKSVPQILESNEIDLVILDIMMPAPDGWEVFRQIRETPGHQDLPVIFMTTLVREDEQEDFNRMRDSCRVLAKPIERQRLYSAIRELLSD
jgi:CheY-like chemotaxis protein